MVGKVCKNIKDSHHDQSLFYRICSRVYCNNISIKCTIMKCWVCDAELVWGGDHDLEPDDSEEYGIVTNLSCPNCESFTEVYHKREQSTDLE